MAGFKRKVFYVGGFDPRGPRFYHALADEQVRRWAAHTGEAATMSTRRTVSATRIDWTIANPDRAATTEYSFLRWDDIVRAAWVRNPFALAWRSARAYLQNARFLDWRTNRRMGLANGPVITLLYPAVFSILFPIVAALPLALLLTIWLRWFVAWPIALVAGIAAARPLLAKMHVPWLLRFFVFNSELGGGERDPRLEQRLDAFAEEIAAALGADWDEILLLTHSNGSVLCVPLMVRLLRRCGGALPGHFTFVSLGHCIPLVAGRRDATQFRQQLAEVAAHEFRWVDIGSPPDGAAYSGIDPMLIVAGDPKPRLTLLSPRFHLFYNPDTYHKGYANKYEVHFDYLRTGDRVSEIDWPSLVATDRPIDRAIAEFKANH